MKSRALVFMSAWAPPRDGLPKDYARAKTGVPLATVAVGGMFGVFFSARSSIRTFEDVKTCDTERFRRFFHGMLDRGIYFAPSAFEAGFLSSAHTDADIDTTLDRAEEVFTGLT